MQTFLPFPNFTESAKVLDMKRLGKQRVETLQILQALKNNGSWVRHPASKMWSNNVDALVLYGVRICEEWRSRGYKATCLEKILAFSSTGVCPIDPVMPVWLGREDIHRSHRQNLTRKLPEHYGKFWDEEPIEGYIWG